MKALEGQTLLDIAIQEAGSVEAAYDLAAGSGLSITDLPNSTELVLPAVANRPLRTYYANKNIQPATALAVDFDTFDETFDYTFD